MKSAALKQSVSCALAVLGMACCWTNVFNQLLYPITFTYYRTSDPSCYSFHIAYSVLVILVCIVLLLARHGATAKLLASSAALACSGVLMALGMFLVAYCDFSTVVSQAFLGLGVACVVLFPLHFLFWMKWAAQRKPDSAALILLGSLVLFCLFTGVRLLLDLRGFFPALIAPLLCGGLAAVMVKIEGLKPVQSDISHASSAKEELAALPWTFIVPSLILVLLSNIGIVFFNSLSVLNHQPTIRYALYFVDAVLFSIAALLFVLSKRASVHTRTLAVFLLFSLFTIGAILFAVFFAERPLSNGTVPFIAANIALQAFVFFLVVQYGSVTKHDVTLPVLVFLVFPVVALRFARACVMYHGEITSLRPTDLTIFAVVSADAFIAVVVLMVALGIVLNRKSVGTGRQDISIKEASHQPKDQPALTFEMRLAAFQQTYDLSDREMDIVGLACNKESARRIGEQLFIAESTVYTHLKRIYRKAGVHSKQELIDLVNGE